MLVVWLCLAGAISAPYTQRLAYLAPVITDQTTSLTAKENDETILRVIAIRATSYSWYKKEGYQWNLVKTSSSGDLSFNPTLVSDAGNYVAVVMGAYGTVKSAPIDMKVSGMGSTSEISITQQLPAELLAVNGAVNLEIKVVSRSLLSYTWFQNGLPVASSNSPKLCLESLPTAGRFYFKCRICSTVSRTCVNSTDAAVISPLDFDGVWPREHQIDARKPMFLRASRPYPDRDDLNVRCLYELWVGTADGIQFDAQPELTDPMGYMVYDEDDIPTLFCSMPRDDGNLKVGTYRIRVFIQEIETKIKDPLLKVHAKLSTMISTVTGSMDSPVVTFRASGFASAGEIFAPGRHVIGVIGQDNLLTSSNHRQVNCVFETSDTLACFAPRARYMAQSLVLKLNGFSNTVLSQLLTTSFDSIDGFQSIDPVVGPLAGGTRLIISGYGWSYANQVLSCKFKAGSVVLVTSAQVGPDMEIECVTPGWTSEDSVIVTIMIGKAEVPVIPVFMYRDFDVGTVYPNFLPTIASADTLLPLSDKEPASFNIGSILDPIFGLDDIIPDKWDVTQAKLSSFFVTGRKLMSSYLFTRLRSSNSVPPKTYDVSCVVLSHELALCRPRAQVPSGSYLIDFSADIDFTGIRSAPLQIFDRHDILNMEVMPKSLSLTSPINMVTMRQSQVRHGLVASFGRADVRVFATYSSKAMPCVVVDEYAVSCSLSPVSAGYDNSDIYLSVQVSGSSTRYRVRSPLKYYNPPRIIGVNPATWIGVFPVKASASFDRPLPDGVSITVLVTPVNATGVPLTPLLCDQVTKVSKSQLLGDTLNPNKITFSVPVMPVSGVVAVDITLIVDGTVVDIGPNNQVPVIYPAVDSITPSCIPFTSEKVYISLDGSGFLESRKDDISLKLKPLFGSTLLLKPIGMTPTTVRFQLEVPQRESLLMPQVSFDGENNFYPIQSKLVVYDPNFLSDVQLEQVVLTPESSQLLIKGTFPQSCGQPLIRVTPLGSLPFTAHGSLEGCCVLKFALPKLTAVASVEVSLNGRDFSRLENRYLKPSN